MREVDQNANRLDNYYCYVNHKSYISYHSNQLGMDKNIFELYL